MTQNGTTSFSVLLFLLVLAFEAGLSIEYCGQITINSTTKVDAECVDLDLNHTALAETGCENTTSTHLCWRQCNNDSYATSKYEGFPNILSPTHNKTKLSYDLKKLNIIYDIGESFMFALQKTSLFDLMEQIITEKWIANGTITQGRLLQIVEAELPWFVVIAFFLLLVLGLTIFVTFSMLDGVFEWTDSTKRQKMDPSNGTWVNFYGFLIILFTILVLCSCLLCFVGNVLVTENSSQASMQLQMDYNWSMAYEEQGAMQLGRFIYEFNEVLLPALEAWYNEVIKTAVERIKAVTTNDMNGLHEQAKKLDTHLTGSRKISELITAVEDMMKLSTYVSANISKVNCTDMIPKLADAWCIKIGFSGASEDACWKKYEDDFSKPTNTIVDASWPVVTTLIDELLIEQMTNSSAIIEQAYSAKIYADFLKGEARWKKLQTTLDERTATNRSEFALQINQAKIMASSQMESFLSQQKEGYKDFTQAIQFPDYFFGETSPLATVNKIRYVAFIVVNGLSLATVFVGVFAWCVGCCNFKADQRPTSRGAKSHYPGMIIYYSSYSALFLSLFCILAGVIYFIPTSLFSFSCDVYKKADEAMHRVVVQPDDPNFFVFWDKHLVVDYNILGLYTHGKKDFNLTFQQFFRSCLKDDALYDALKLKEEWPTIPTILAVNETLNTEYFIDEMKKASFRDQYIMEDAIATLTDTLSKVLAELTFTNLETTFKSTTTLFNDTQENVEAWQKNIAEWNKQMEKKLKNEDDYKAFKEHCLEKWVEDKDVMKTYEEYDFKAVLAAASKANTTTTDGSTTQSRKKRFNWDDFDDGGDDSGGSKGKNDYSKLGIGALSKQFNENMAKYNTLYQTLNTDILMTKAAAADTYARWSVLQPYYLDTQGPAILLSTIVEYGNIILTEIDCFVITVSKQIEHQMGQCRTIYDVLDGTMTYFCNFLVGPMTVTWISFLLGGIALSLYIQAARAVSMYFLKMDAVHPGDISQAEKIASMKGEK